MPGSVNSARANLAARTQVYLPTVICTARAGLEFVPILDARAGVPADELRVRRAGDREADAAGTP